MVPNPGLPTVESGGLKLTWLKALNSSPRNWKYFCSVTLNRLANPRSHCWSPGPQTVSRPAVPYGVVCNTNALGLNQAAGPGFDTVGETPGTTSARMLRSPPIWQAEHAGLEMVTGRPV